MSCQPWRSLAPPSAETVGAGDTPPTAPSRGPPAARPAPPPRAGPVCHAVIRPRCAAAGGRRGTRTNDDLGTRPRCACSAVRTTPVDERVVWPEKAGRLKCSAVRTCCVSPDAAWSRFRLGRQPWQAGPPAPGWARRAARSVLPPRAARACRARNPPPLRRGRGDLCQRDRGDPQGGQGTAGGRRGTGMHNDSGTRPGCPCSDVRTCRVGERVVCRGEGGPAEVFGRPNMPC